MRKLFLLFAFFGVINSVYSQRYLLDGVAWENKIKAEHLLAPLFYGIKKDSAEIHREKGIVEFTLKKYGSKDVACQYLLTNGWNYFVIGQIDSAVISFNKAYLLDDNDPKTFAAMGSVLTFVNGKPSEKLITEFNLFDKVSSGWDVIAFFGDTLFLDELRKILKNRAPLNLSAVLQHPQLPFAVDSGKYILVKIKYDDREGFYRAGRQYGTWTDYYNGTTRVKVAYTILNGFRVGEAKAYYKNGNLANIFHYNDKGELNGESEIFDYTGQPVRTEYWEHNEMHPINSKIIKEWEKDGTTTSGVINGKPCEYIWKDGKKTLKVSTLKKR